MISFSPRSFCLLTLTSLLLLGAGCSSPTFEFATTLDDGQKVRAEMAMGHPVLSETDEFAIKSADYVVEQKTKGIVAKFSLVVKRGPKPVAIMVQDVTNSPFKTWVDDKKPTFSEKAEWTGDTLPHRIDEGPLVWLTTVNLSMRVFRFTLTLPDGHTVVIHQVASFPGFYKAGIRQAAGYAEPK